MTPREYPLNLTYEEITAVAGALEGYEAEYGLSGAFYAPSTLPSGATVEQHRAEARRASDAANARAERLLTKIGLLRTTAAELEPLERETSEDLNQQLRQTYGDCIIEGGPGNDLGAGLGEIDGGGA